MTPLKTPKGALNYLLGLSRLMFGSTRQIEALQLLRAAEALIGLEYSCSWCGGSGKTSESGHCDVCGRECAHCGGETVRECRKCNGTGKGEYKRDVVYQMCAEEIWRALKDAQPKAA